MGTPLVNVKKTSCDFFLKLETDEATMPELRTDRVRLTILIYRKEGISTEDFHTYWRTKHAGIFTGIAIVKKNLLRYEQVRLIQLPPKPSWRMVETSEIH